MALAQYKIRKLKIKKIVVKDLRPVSILFVDVFSNSPWDEYWELDWAYERLSWIYQSSGFAGYVAIDNKQVCGAIMGHFVPFQGKKGFQVIEFLVASDRQNQGIGTKLLNQLESNLKQNNYNFVFLLTAKESSAESFYTKRSYQRDSKIVLLNKEL